MIFTRINFCQLGLIVVGVGGLLSSTAFAEDILLNETFEAIEEGKPLASEDSWEAFRGFNGTPPLAVVKKGLGRENSKALVMSHSEGFRADSWGATKQLSQEISEGVLWLDCYFYPPKQWTANQFFFDVRSATAIIARVAVAPYQNPDESVEVMRAHASWTKSSWRMYRQVPLKAEWYRLTMRLDLDRGNYAAWINDEVLGEELPLCSRQPVRQVYLGLGGTADDPARVDDLQVRRSAPEGREMRSLIPSPESDLSFRMAVVGDPQVGFSTYEADMIRFNDTVQQINRSKAELTLVMGDMVQDMDQEKAYQEVKQAAAKLKGPCYFVRGNHDRLDLFQKHFHPQADFAFRHKGWRFIFLDAIGNLRGLKDEQLAFVEKELKQAKDAGEQSMVCLHVSPWQDNEKGRSGYNQIGPGRDRLVELLDQYQVKFCLSGHYHRGLWHVEKQATHYMVFGGTAQVKQGWLSWCIFDVYPDRVVIHEKPVYFGYERPDTTAFYNFNYARWASYEEALKKYPYLQRGPATVSLKSSPKK